VFTEAFKTLSSKRPGFKYRSERPSPYGEAVLHQYCRRMAWRLMNETPEFVLGMSHAMVVFALFQAGLPREDRPLSQYLSDMRKKGWNDWDETVLNVLGQAFEVVQSSREQVYRNWVGEIGWTPAIADGSPFNNPPYKGVVLHRSPFIEQGFYLLKSDDANERTIQMNHQDFSLYQQVPFEDLEQNWRSCT